MNAITHIEQEIAPQAAIIFGQFGQSPEAMVNFITALAKAQGEFDIPEENCTGNVNPKDQDRAGYTFKYADLASLIKATKKQLAENGLAVTAVPVTEDGILRLRMYLLHSGGGYMQGDIDIPKIDDLFVSKLMMTLGGVMAFSRRYLYKAMLNLAESESMPTNEPEGEGVQGQFTRTATAVKSHPQLKDAKTLGDLSARFLKIPQSERKSYMPYYEQRQQELSSQAPQQGSDDSGA